MHKEYEVLKGIKLPGKLGCVSGRVYNWLLCGEEEDIQPASCYVVLQNDSNFGKFFIDVASKLSENAGVNVVLDKIHTHLKTLEKYQRKGYFVEPDDKDWGKMEIFTEKEDDNKFKVADSLKLKSEKSKKRFPKHISIFQAFELVFNNSLGNSTINIDFSEIREADEKSSGKESFIEVCKLIQNFGHNPTLTNYLTVLSALCACIKRGGFRRPGALSSTMAWHNPLYREYLNIPFSALSHLKKGTGITNFINYGLLKELLKKINDGEMFLEKFLGYSQGQTMYPNVCRGLSLIPGDRCLVSPVNLGMCRTREGIILGFKEVTIFLLEVFEAQYSDKSQILDRQIAVGMCGLANMLKINKITYREFINEIVCFNSGLENGNIDDLFNDFEERAKTSKVAELVLGLQEGMQTSAYLGKQAGMRATLAIEPNASVARRYKDADEWDLVPNIDPPNTVPGIGVEKRHSETGVYLNGNLIDPVFSYGKDIEPASSLTQEDHFYLWVEIQRMMENTGMAHGACYEQWSELTVAGFYQWLNSPLKFMYYRRDIGTKHLEKGTSIPARARLEGKRKDKGVVSTGTVENETPTLLNCPVDSREICEACD